MKTLKSQMVDRIVTTANTGRRMGAVMAQNRRHAVAPSTLAASCSSCGIVMSPASTVIATNGNPWCTTLSVAIA
ncbi:Uncharacterised protein [Mycobacteroides abscessus]|nr:Uncharacterised protein [Mycobacteroides abscessus]